jgi:hypothetical protein
MLPYLELPKINPVILLQYKIKGDFFGLEGDAQLGGGEGSYYSGLRRINSRWFAVCWFGSRE